LIYPYIKNYQIFACPSRSNATLLAPPNSTTPYSLGYGYCMGNGTWTSGVCPDSAGARLATFANPSTTPKVAESWAKAIKVPKVGTACSWISDTDLSGPVGGACNGPACPHNTGANVGFMDGHVKWVSSSGLLGSASTTGAVTW
jgi:prepilin-type processing-associated H-X9-DG protein